MRRVSPFACLVSEQDAMPDHGIGRRRPISISSRSCALVGWPAYGWWVEMTPMKAPLCDSIGVDCTERKPAAERHAGAA